MILQTQVMSNFYKTFSGVLICLFLLISLNLYSQRSTLSFQHLAPENGMAQDKINCINQDKDGFIWVSSYNGISKFDGHSMKKLRYNSKDSLKVEAIIPSCIFRDHKDRMWMGEGNTIFRYDFLNGEMKCYRDDSIFKKKIGKLDITAICEDVSGNIWIGTRKGLFQFIENKHELSEYLNDTTNNYLESYNKNRITDLLSDKHGNIWVGTLFGIYKFNIITHKFVQPYKMQFSADVYNDRINSVEFDKEGHLWISIFDYGIKVMDTATNKVSVINVNATKGQLNSNMIQKILCDDDGNIWLAHDTKGINIYHTKTKTYESYKHDESDIQSLVDDRISTLFKDKFGMIWIGTQTEGVDRVSRMQSNFNTYTQHPGKSNTPCENGILSACEDKVGNLWIGSQNGLMYYDRTKQTFTCFHHEENHSNSLSNDQIHAVAVDHNEMVWIGTNNGLNVYNPRTRKWKNYLPDKKIPSSISNEVINSICVRSNGEIWIGTNNLICRYQPKGDCFETRYNNENIKKISREFYMRIFEDSKHTMWVASSRGGVYNLDDSIKIFKRYSNDPKKPNCLPSNSVNDFAEDMDGNIWMATNWGIAKLNKETQTFNVYNTSDGLAINKINQLKIADDGKIWVATNAGLSELSFDDRGKPVVKNYNATDGLQSNLFYECASLKLHTGELLFGGSKGFNLFRPESIVFNKTIPEVEISSFSILDKEIDNLSQVLELKKLKLSHTQNFFSFDMAAISFDYPEKNQYAYQLEGFDKTMIQCGNRYHVSYTNIPPGIYTLHVIASNNDGVWNNEGLRLQIEITPPFWMTWYFRSIMIAVLLISLIIIVRFISTRKLRKQLAFIEQQREIENIRSRISRDIHDEIGSGLTRISVLGEMMKTDITNKKENVSTTINKIIASSREITGNLSEIVWTINPQYDNLQSLLSYMRNYINKCFEDSSIECTIIFPSKVSPIQIHPDIKRNIFLVLKESLNNIMKHSKAKNVAISFEINEKKFKLTIADDGIGFMENNKNEFGNGIKNIQTRMNDIKASCKIISTPGKGTTIFIEGSL